MSMFFKDPETSIGPEDCENDHNIWLALCLRNRRVSWGWQGKIVGAFWLNLNDFFDCTYLVSLELRPVPRILLSRSVLCGRLSIGLRFFVSSCISSRAVMMLRHQEPWQVLSHHDSSNARSLFSLTPS